MCRVHISIEDSWVTLVCKVSSHHLQSLTFIPLGKGETWWALDFCQLSALPKVYMCTESQRQLANHLSSTSGATMVSPL